MAETLKDPEYWRDRASQTRALAEEFSRTPIEMQRLLRAANEYERLAVVAEQWLAIDNELPH